MKIFLARLQGEGDRGGEIVGIFAAEDDQHLGHLIDEVTDPSQVEVLELDGGGIYWSGKVDFKIPVPTGDQGEPLSDDELPNDYSVTESWRGDWYGDGDQAWRPVVFERE